jgi:hypothetical protein
LGNRWQVLLERGIKEFNPKEIGRSVMTTRQPRHSREEFARRGQELCEQTVRGSVQPGDEGKFVAIDVDSGEHEMDRDDYRATERLLSRHPDAQIWLTQVGQPAAYRLGARSSSGSPK